MQLRRDYILQVTKCHVWVKLNSKIRDKKVKNSLNLFWQTHQHDQFDCLWPKTFDIKQHMFFILTVSFHHPGRGRNNSKPKSSVAYSSSLRFHARRARINSTPKKVIYSTASHLASKKEETEILNFHENFLFCEVFVCVAQDCSLERWF